MKLRVLMIAAASALLFLIPRSASAAEPGGPPDAAMPAHAVMQHNANESAQATTDMSLGQGWQSREQPVQNTAYGGVAGGQAEMGGGHARPCAIGSGCKVYFGQ
ncbi:hypothetical protein BTH42_28340 [Burkholderia sp. SRS-W-2-2016]|uniref:hypothetical protein n=1 Tax=Burkholderia sp. SRS-W-2-2016 TaxID=1926878 RepID=UPI00094B6632|nr:hypothetical protein [Burkholderia sp. SRS-W-2-2016]OLL28274.1 hypothetical protein BTH42_28340 [Burkholderia sp. SRS-W-2-2016]